MNDRNNNQVPLVVDSCCKVLFDWQIQKEIIKIGVRANRMMSFVLFYESYRMVSSGIHKELKLTHI